MDEEEIWDDLEEDYDKEAVDLDAGDDDELYKGFGEEGDYGDEE